MSSSYDDEEVFDDSLEFATEGPIVSLNTVYLDNNPVLGPNCEDIPFAGARKTAQLVLSNNDKARIAPPSILNKKSILKSTANPSNDKGKVTVTNKACGDQPLVQQFRERPKTVAFGRTVPLSQTIEATKTPIQKPAAEMNNTRRFVIRADLDEFKELINAQKIEIEALKQRIEQLESKDKQQSSDLGELFDTQARFSDRLMKVENAKNESRTIEQPSNKSIRNINIGRELNENFYTLQPYRPNSPPPSSIVKPVNRYELNCSDDLNEKVEQLVQEVESNPDLLQYFMKRLGVNPNLNQALPLLKDRSNTNSKSGRTSSQPASYPSRSVIQRKVIAAQVQQDFHPESPRGLRKSTIQWVEQVQHEQSPIRQHNRISPKRYNERRSTSNKFNRLNGTRPKQPAAYDDEEDDEIVSKQPPDYFNTNDDPLENSEEYDSDSRIPTPPRERRNKSPVYRNHRN
uniref:Protein-tyrosine-phosphatase n=1 Tax=Acrobeloides nanus TaxID=290746 RepID=A0A914DSX8_9BILA